jgi:hypothetical protein
MPVVSQAQHALIMEDLRRLDAGERPRTGMTREQLEEMVEGVNVHELPERVERPKKAKR